MGEDQDAAGARGLDEAERGDRLAGAGRVLEPEALGGVGVVGRLVGRRPRPGPTSRRGSSSASSSSPQLLGQVLLAREAPRRRARAARRRPAPLARPLPLPLRCDSASSAVSVPESASTWWAESTVPSTSAGSSWESRRSRPEQQRPAAAPVRRGHLGALVELGQRRSRARRGAGCRARARSRRSSPSSRKGSRANEAARSRSSEDGRDATARVAVSGSAMKARQIDVREKSRGPPRDFEQPGPQWGGVVWSACPGSTPYSSRVQRRLRPICHRMSRCDGLRPFSPGLRWSRCSSSGCARRAAETAAPAEARTSTSPRPSASWPARPRRWPRCTTSPRSCSPAVRTAFRKRLAALKGYPVVVNKWASWCAPVPHRVPDLPVAGRRRRARRSPSSASTPATRRAPPRRFLSATPLPFPSYLDPDEDIAKTIKAPANYPITVFFDRRGKLAYVHQGGYRREADLVDDMQRYLS